MCKALDVDAKEDTYSQLAPSLESVDPFHNFVLVGDFVELMAGVSKLLFVLKRSHRKGSGCLTLNKSSNISLRRGREISKGSNKRDMICFVMMFKILER